MKYISIYTILNELKEDFIEEDTIIQWSSDCLDSLGCSLLYQAKIAFLNIKNYKAQLPKNYVSTEGLFLMNDYTNKTQVQIKEILTPIFGTSCEFKTEVINKDICEDSCCVTVESPEGLFPFINYNRVIETSYCNQSNIFTNRLTYSKYLHQESPLNLYTIADEQLQFAVKSGKAVLFYLEKVVDENQLPMLPDNVIIIDAVVKYVEQKKAWIEYKTSKTQDARAFFTDVNALKNEAMQKARTYLNTPDWESAKALAKTLTTISPNYEERFSHARNKHRLSTIKPTR